MSLVKTLRRVGGPLLAALLTLAVLTPTMDLFVCAGDQQPTAITSIAGSTQAGGMQEASDVQKKSSIPVERHDADDDGCVHGHCHHGIGVAKLADAELTTDAMRGDKVLPWLPDAPDLALSLGLLRPPRA